MCLVYHDYILKKKNNETFWKVVLKDASTKDLASNRCKISERQATNVILVFSHFLFLFLALGGPYHNLLHNFRNSRSKPINTNVYPKQTLI